MSTLTLREAPPERLDLAGLTPAALAGLSEARPPACRSAPAAAA